MSRFVDNLTVFGRFLRDLGLDVHVGRLLDLTEALQHVDVGSRVDVHLACRALLVHRQEDLALFDAAFDAFWLAHGASESALQPGRQPARAQVGETPGSQDLPVSTGSPRGADRAARAVASAAAGDRAADDAGVVDAAGVLRTWSDMGAVAAKDFAEFHWI